MSQERLLNTLVELELSQYYTAFTENDIDFDTFQTLSNDDLKDIGVTSLGHRKKLCAKIAELSGTTAPTGSSSVPQQPAKPVKQASGLEEKVFLEEMVVGSDRHEFFGIRNVKITSHRAIVGDKTYSLKNMAAVSITNDCLEVDAINDQIDAQYKSSRTSSGCGRIVVVGLGLLMLIGGFAGMADNDIELALTGLVMGVGFLVLAAVIKATPGEHLDYSYAVQIDSGGTSSSVLWSTSKPKVDKIVKALNDAIVNMSV